MAQRERRRIMCSARLMQPCLPQHHVVDVAPALAPFASLFATKSHSGGSQSHPLSLAR
jgi:hypothetical protein